MNHWKFRLTLASGHTYFVDNVDSVLRVVDNNQANKNGRVITRIEYARMIESREFFTRRVTFIPERWYTVTAEELRRHDIRDIYDVDNKRDGVRLLGCLVAIVATCIAGAVYVFFGDEVKMLLRLIMQ